MLQYIVCLPEGQELGCYLLGREKMPVGCIFREKWSNRERINEIFKTIHLVKGLWKLSTLMNFGKSIDRNIK